MPYFAVTMGNYSSEKEIINIPIGKLSFEFTTGFICIAVIEIKLE